MRLGGISGILFVVLVVPSFLSAPDTPVATSASQDVIDYFNERQDGILTNNGLLLVFAAFFFLWFLGVLYGVLRRGYEASSLTIPCESSMGWLEGSGSCRSPAELPGVAWGVGGCNNRGVDVTIV